MITTEDKLIIEDLLSLRSKIVDVEDIFPNVEELRESIGLSESEKFEERTYYFWTHYEELLQKACKFLLNQENKSEIVKLSRKTKKLEIDYYSIVIDYLIYCINNLIRKDFSNQELFVKFKTLEKEFIVTTRKNLETLNDDAVNKIKSKVDEFYNLFYEFEGFRINELKSRRDQRANLKKWVATTTIAALGLIIAAGTLAVTIFIVFSK